MQLEENSWVYVYAPQASPPHGDALANKKLSLDWAGPCLVGQIDAGGQVVREFEVHGTKIRPVHLNRQQRESRFRQLSSYGLPIDHASTTQAGTDS